MGSSKKHAKEDKYSYIHSWRRKRSHNSWLYGSWKQKTTPRGQCILSHIFLHSFSEIFPPFFFLFPLFTSYLSACQESPFMVTPTSLHWSGLYHFSLHSKKTDFSSSQILRDCIYTLYSRTSYLVSEIQALQFPDFWVNSCSFVAHFPRFHGKWHTWHVPPSRPKWQEKA